MRIAIIEDSLSYREILKGKVEKTDWDVDFFVNASDFGRVSLSSYDVIVADYHLPSINGRDLIRSLSTKTSAQMFLMGDSTSNFEEEDVHNDRIKGLINKEDPENVIAELRYIDSKIKLKDLMEKERNILGSIFPTNGFSMDTDNDTAIIEIHELLSQASKDKILRQFNENSIKNLILSFSIGGVVSSPYLGLIIFLFKEIKNRGGKMAFINTNNRELIEQIKMCNLSMLFPIFNSIEEARRYIKEETGMRASP